MSDPLYPVHTVEPMTVEFITYLRATRWSGNLWLVACPDCGYVDPAGNCFDNMPEAWNAALDIQLFHYCPTPREVI